MKRLEAIIAAWLDRNVEADGPPATDPHHVLESIRAGDVVLVAGRTRMSRFIRFLSGSPWTHVALCLGRSEEYNADPALRDLVARASYGDPKEPVLIEALLGRGTILTPLRHYRAHAVKICRPSSLSEKQVNRVIRFAVRHLVSTTICGTSWTSCASPSPCHRLRGVGVNAVRPRLRGIQALYLLDPAGAVIHLRGPPHRRVAAPHGYAAYKASLEANPRLATPRDFDASPYFEYLEFPPNSPPARPVPRLPQAKAWRARGTATPFHPGLFPGQALEPCYATVPLRPAQRLRGKK